MYMMLNKSFDCRLFFCFVSLLIRLKTMEVDPGKYIEVDRFLHVTLDVKGESPKKSDSVQNVEPVYYTLKHFRNIMQSILHDSHYNHLFNEDDWKVITKFTEFESKSVHSFYY